MSTLTQRRSARSAYTKAARKPLGQGSRFAAIERSAKLGGATNPAAVAATIGRKKYGVKKMASWSAAARRAG